MVLVDTSIWIDHFRRSDSQLSRLLERGDIVMHPFIIGELLLGRVPRIAEMIDDLNILPKAVVASTDEILRFISNRKLPGSGIGYVCPGCGACFRGLAGFRALHADHLTPWKENGKTTWANLQLLCGPCNLSKSAKLPLACIEHR